MSLRAVKTWINRGCVSQQAEDAIEVRNRREMAVFGEKHREH